MKFDEAHHEFIQFHIKRRTGERRGRLERGHQHAEKLFCQHVWWPLQGQFNHLHPEFEVVDWRGQSYFCDFVWLSTAVGLIIEIKGFGPHVRDMDRQKYSNELNRETFLVAMGYQVTSFSYDDIAHRPELCITLLRMVLSRYLSGVDPIKLKQVVEREVIRLACRLARPLKPVDVASHLEVNHRTAVRLLQSLQAKGLFHAVIGNDGKRVARYEMQQHALKLL
ncbi:endonuclease domain-containing protein [Paenibacillus sp. SC116]|uniref:endonuclease domain-containing protein n=1 Tax=Paenibacillus sp. SC116 TaxID=2968986 RepID=UPI00215A74E1|nr:endonuclease domain-containing protein [Paenibacillus sp. SC116]MCR8843965.1 endonuclease domain-containing protein [Paenibacillus sp. SC116]